jgi:hypothetical protein
MRAGGGFELRPFELRPSLTFAQVVKLVIKRSTWPGGPWNHEAGDYVQLSFGSKNKAAQPITNWLKPLSFKETTPVGGPPLPPAFL